MAEFFSGALNALGITPSRIAVQRREEKARQELEEHRRQMHQRPKQEKQQSSFGLSMMDEIQRLPLLEFVELRELLQLDKQRREFFHNRFHGDIQTMLNTLQSLELDSPFVPSAEKDGERELYRKLLQEQETRRKPGLNVPHNTLDKGLQPRSQRLRRYIQDADKSLQWLFSNIEQAVQRRGFLTDGEWQAMEEGGSKLHLRRRLREIEIEGLIGEQERVFFDSGLPIRVDGYVRRLTIKVDDYIDVNGRVDFRLNGRDGLLRGQGDEWDHRQISNSYGDIEWHRRFDDWKYCFDNDFARSFISPWSKEASTLSNLKTPTQCCTQCSPVLLSNQKVNISELYTSKESCKLCNLLLRTVKRSSGDGQNFQVSRLGSALTVEPGGHRILRLCSSIDSLDGQDETQISFPVLPAAGSRLHTALLGKWLDWCNSSHHCYRVSKQLPTRLLYVGNSDSSNLRLVSGHQNGVGNYVALSHCWGVSKAGELPLYCTTKQNIHQRERQEGFSIEELPATFKDAVYVARRLSVQYLWIDSLCIIQGDTKDWECEAKRMDDVYASAYCTIAATSAVDSEAGFLRRVINEDYVYVQDNKGRGVYVCSSIGDFDKEVEDSRLNTRAWVLQERYLSCRTIHFGANQTYWECGEGIYCEDLTKLKSSKGRTKHLKLDPEFPRLLYNSGHAVTIYFLQSLLEDYSKRGLSNATDRVVAFSGLATRLSKSLKCEERYGIFDIYLHRTLLWQRSGCERFDPKKKDLEKPIAYKSPGVPSWSWMTYQGGVQFMEIRFGDLDLSENLRFDPKDIKVLIAQLWAFCGCQLELGGAPDAKGRLKLVFGSDPQEKGWIMYDVDGEKDLSQEQCVVVGRQQTSQFQDSEEGYTILVVKHRGGNEYGRVGIGMVQAECISRGMPGVRVL